ncbi:MAG TPA: tetratricopeptide repeat protein [Polyangia bacterium]|jgi:tetratricopeptide (TPR) repeat protein
MSKQEDQKIKRSVCPSDLLIFLFLFVVGCGPAVKQAEIPKLPPAKPEAIEALKDAARLVRLGPGNQERALERLKDAVEIDPGLWEAWYDAGWIELGRHHTDEAIAALEKAQSILPTHAPTAQALAQAYAQANRPGDAAKTLRAFLDKQPGAKEANAVRVQLANAQRRANKLDEATETLRAVLRVEPRSAPALSALGMVYEARGQHELADLVLHRALDIDKESKAAADVYNNLGLVALARRRDQEAFADFDSASRIDPALTVARRNKAMVYLDCGDYARAAEELRAVTHADGTDVEAWNALGVAERGESKFDAAQKAYEKALAADPNGPGAADALFNLGVLQMDFLKQPQKARARFDEFMKHAGANHPRRADAESRLRELAKTAPAPAQSKEGGSS